MELSPASTAPQMEMSFSSAVVLPRKRQCLRARAACQARHGSQEIYEPASCSVDTCRCTYFYFLPLFEQIPG